MERINFPITATSANISGEENLLEPKKIIEKFSKRKNTPDLFVNSGKVPDNKPSTIVDLTTNHPKILRVGIVGKEKIQEFFKKFEF
jgi:tRNA A37 threonylcarbamoyladenosine synthetase subunit TsaC/SUA5/YrdC